MTDVLTPLQRHACMASIRSTNTGPELVVRSLVHRMGFRFRLHRRDLPGKPDLVFSSRHAVIFVHGCFWHRHDCRFGRVAPKTRVAFWRAKFQQNKARDAKVSRQLRQLGWRVLVIWECETESVPAIRARICRFLTRYNSGSPRGHSTKR
jgi:DNA mismatch endonuclease (patch repair protein)